MIFVVWKWTPISRYRTIFRAEHVNTMLSMISRHYHAPFELVCITDDPKHVDPAVRCVTLWDTFASVPSPHGGVSPACYRRLRAFSSEMKDVIGPRFVSIDLDTVIVGDITEMMSRQEDFLIYRHQHRLTPYNGSLWMMNAGAREQVYTKFDPQVSPVLARKAGFNGSDQAWISYILGPDEAGWDKKDGVYDFRVSLKNKMYALPSDARIVSFHGHDDPWSEHSQKVAPWVKEHYR